MPRKFLGQIIFCTDISDNSTKKIAELIRAIINENQKVVIFSSPEPNALKTAGAIAMSLDIKQKILKAPAISKAQKRFFSFFSDLVKWFVANMNSPLRIIAVSHHEVLCHFIENLIKGEIIIINVYDDGVRNKVRIEIAFRKKTLRKIFDYKKQKIE